MVTTAKFVGSVTSHDLTNGTKIDLPTAQSRDAVDVNTFIPITLHRSYEFFIRGAVSRLRASRKQGST